MATRAKRKPLIYRDQRTVTKDDIEIGLRIRMRRLELKKPQQDLAKALSVSFQQVQKYEKGTNRISGARFLQICRALEVDPNYLLGWHGKPVRLDEAQTTDTVNLRIAQATWRAIASRPEGMT